MIQCKIIAAIVRLQWIISKVVRLNSFTAFPVVLSICKWINTFWATAGDGSLHVHLHDIWQYLDEHRNILRIFMIVYNGIIWWFKLDERRENYVNLNNILLFSDDGFLGWKIYFEEFSSSCDQNNAKIGKHTLESRACATIFKTN